ncbi:MAG: DUF4832 domain-containing protein [Lacunisphaera sp.]|nr:DUF4832 domain-containing protein [Lacunisphaera sp.]
MLVAGETAPISLIMENRGVAPPYAPYELRVKLSGAGGRVVHTLTTGCQSWLPGTPVSASYQLPVAADLQPGAYDLAIGLFDLHNGKERPVEFALQANLRDAEGYYRVTEVEVTSRAKAKR